VLENSIYTDHIFIFWPETFFSFTPDLLTAFSRWHLKTSSAQMSMEDMEIIFAIVAAQAIEYQN